MHVLRITSTSINAINVRFLVDKVLYTWLGTRLATQHAQVGTLYLYVSFQCAGYVFYGDFHRYHAICATGHDVRRSTLNRLARGIRGASNAIRVLGVMLLYVKDRLTGAERPT